MALSSQAPLRPGASFTNLALRAETAWRRPKEFKTSLPIRLNRGGGRRRGANEFAVRIKTGPGRAATRTLDRLRGRAQATTCRPHLPLVCHHISLAL